MIMNLYARTGFSLLCIILFFFSDFSGASGASLIVDGESRYSIVLASDASPGEKHAASELQNFLRIISGAKLPIVRDGENVTGPVILVGESKKLRQIDAGIDFIDLGDEGFVMKTAGDNLILAGGRKRGSLYAVYTFLEEKLGCRWYSSRVSKIPERKTIEIGSIDETQKPAFKARYPFWYDAFDPDWSARNKCNGSTRLDEVRGGRFIYQGGHTFHRFIPPPRYFENHPEYFSFIEGRRTFERYRSQICLTNPEVVGITKHKVHAWIEETPEAEIFSVSQGDGGAGECKCVYCKPIDEREGAPSGNVIYFVNKVAEYIEKDYPDKMIGTMAYHYTSEPPRYAKARENVVVRLCHNTSRFGCDAHPLEDCFHNRTFSGYVRGWKEKAHHLYIWDYLTVFQHYLLPKPSYYTIPKDLRFFQKNSVLGVFHQGAYSGYGGANAEMQAYIGAKLLWNPERDIKEVMNDFLEGFYGPAAPALRKYYDLMHRKVFNEWIHFPINAQADAAYLSNETLAQADTYFDEAEKLARGNPDDASRVEAARLWIRYAKLAKPVEHIAEDGWYKPAPSIDAPAMLRELDDFLETCERHNIHPLQEYGYPRDKHIRSYFTAYKIVSLENDELKVDVIPGIGGRILQVYHKKKERNLLREGERTRRNGPSTIPAPLGYSDGVFPQDSFEYKLSTTPSGMELSMMFESDNMICTREMILTGGKPEIRFATKVEAKEDIQRGMRINPSPLFDLGVLSEIKTGFVSDEKALVEVPSLSGLADGDAINTVFMGAEVKSNAWMAYNTVEKIGVVNIYDKKELEGCIVSGNRENNDISLSLSGIYGPLKKGDVRELHHRYVFVSE